MKSEYGIPVPRGVQKDWVAIYKNEARSAGSRLSTHVPSDWGEPTSWVTWVDRFQRPRLVVGHYPDGRSATVRIDANGNWKTLFGDVG